MEVKSEDILQMRNITKVFPGVKALDNVDFSCIRGEIHGLIGANGAGKSTLIKILSGAYQKTEGNIVFDGKKLEHYNTIDARHAGIAVIYQEMSLIDSISVAENIFLNEYDGIVNWDKMKEDAEAICQRFNLSMDVKQRVNRLSIGQKQLVEIMKAISIGAKIVVMDEPSATLSEEEFAVLLQVIADLKKEGITIIYISHRLDEIFKVCDRVTILKDGKNVVTKRKIDLTMDSLVEYMIGHRVETERIINKNVKYGTEPVLRMNGVTSKHVGPIDFNIHDGEVFGIYGLVGSGRTEVLRTIFGVDQIIKGNIEYKGNRFIPKSPRNAIRKGIGLVPENRKKEGLVQVLPVWENATIASYKDLSKSGLLSIVGLKKIARDYINKLLIKTPSENVIVRNLSGGNQQKVVLAKWLIKDCEFLLVDEPTQGIDVGAKDQIYKIINDIVEAGKSVIIVSSELDELVRICNRIAVMYEGKQINIFDMDHTNKDELLTTALTGRLK